MNEEMQRLEDATRASPEYARALDLLVEREQVEQQLRQLDHQFDVLGAAGKLAWIDRLRQSLLVSTRLVPPIG